MFPKLFDLGPIGVYTYGVLLAAAYLVALQVGMMRARARGLDANRVMDLGIYCIISALVGAKLLLVIVDFDHYWQDPANLLTIIRSGGVYYGGFLLAVAVGFWFIRRHGLPLWQTCDAFAPGIVLARSATVADVRCVCSGYCAGSSRRSARMPHGRMLLWSTNRSSVGNHLHEPASRGQLWYASRCGAAPNPTLRVSGGTGDTRNPLGERTAWPPVPGSDILELPPPVSRRPFSHRVLSR